MRTWITKPLSEDCFPWLTIEGWLFKEAEHTLLMFTLNAVDGCRGVRFGIGCKWLFNLWITLDFAWMRRWLPHRWSDHTQSFLPVVREVGFTIHGWFIWCKLWSERFRYGEQPWWMEFEISLLPRWLRERIGNKRYR